MVEEARQTADATEAMRDLPPADVMPVSSPTDSQLAECRAELHAAIESGNQERVDAARRALQAEEFRTAYAAGKRRMFITPGGGDVRLPVSRS